MAVDWRGVALEKAELLSARIKELVSLGQGYVLVQLGVDLGLKPELYPTWVVLSTAGLGVLLLVVSWAAVCGGVLAGRRRGSPVTRGSQEPSNFTDKSVKVEETRKKNKKKTAGEKILYNGQPLVAQAEVKEPEAVSRPTKQTKTAKVVEVQAQAQVKKNKKKNKPEVKPIQDLVTNDSREHDDGAWETKVSNKEKRQQRRKDKGSEDSGSPRALEASKSRAEAPMLTGAAKKRRGNNDNQHTRTASKGEAASGAGKGKAQTLTQEPSVNGGSWSHASLKTTGQMGPTEGPKGSSISASTRHRPQKEWTQESRAAWSSSKTTAFSAPGLNPADNSSNSSLLAWTNQSSADNELSEFNGMAASEASSDWFAPEEYWGNCPELSTVMATAFPQESTPNQVSAEEKSTADSSNEAGKHKKRRKNKKKTEDEPASDSQVQRAALTGSIGNKAQGLPVLASNVHNSGVFSSQKRSEQTLEPQKPSQKKKVRRET